MVVGESLEKDICCKSGDTRRVKWVQRSCVDSERIRHRKAVSPLYIAHMYTSFSCGEFVG